jgi:hypothetical protein
MMEALPDWFQPVRMVALCLIYLMFLLQLFSVHRAHQHFKRWAEDEAARRARWAEDMAAIGKLREEAYHLRAQAEVALAQARRHLAIKPEGLNAEPNGNGS